MYVVSPKLDRLIFWVETLFAVVPTVYGLAIGVVNKEQNYSGQALKMHFFFFLLTIFN